MWMHELDDNALLREFAERGSEPAFAELVTRHVNKVYSVALRHTRNPHQAEEITQAVFVILARKAGQLGKKVILSGWLYQTARLTAVTLIRSEIRRARREQEVLMQTSSDESAADPWPHIAPLLDDAMAGLSETDRHAVVLRYFDGKSLKDVGTALGGSEHAAKMRVNRAVEKLRAFFTKRGVAISTAVLTTMISANSVQAAPVALAQSATAMAITKGVAASGSTLTLIKGALKIMAWTKTKTVITAGVILLLVGGTTAVTVEQAREKRLEKIWRINKDVPTAVIDKLPPIFKMLPTKFGPPWANWNAGSNGDKFAGARAGAAMIAMYAYNISWSQIRFDCDYPTNRYDFVATLPHGNAEALQRELKDKLGLVGHREMKNMDVLLLRVVTPNAPGLKQAIFGKEDTWWKAGAYHTSSRPIDSGDFEGFAYFVTDYFGKPVIDQTGLGRQHFAIDLRWKENKFHDNPDGLKQVMREKLGFEVVPTNMPVEVLVMEKAR
jgi:uncharacterized protein (TIGR03435 family)